MDTSPLRKFTIVAQDPRVKFDGRILTAEIEIPNEVLGSGPGGYRVKVVDYDASNGTMYGPWTPGRGGSEEQPDPYRGVQDREILGDPRFHAQNAYAIVMRVLALFESALGRRVSWSFRGHRLHVAPHAFADANAYYSKRDRALMFGYFPSRNRRDTVFTCLSHDIVAHETVHALVDGLRERYTDPATLDQSAFHEGFADAIALLSMFGLEETVEKVLSSRALKGLVGRRGDDPRGIDRRVFSECALAGLAEQVGEELSGIRGMPLRRSIDIPPDKEALRRPEYAEPHRRGEVFVAAVLHSFLEVWKKRVWPVRTIPETARSLVIEEGAKAASHLLQILIRTIDYTPPTELTFGDFLSALLTADREIYPADKPYGYRNILRKNFGAFGIQPASRGVPEEPGLWSPERRDELSYDRVHFEFLRRDPDEVFRFLWENRKKLDIFEDAYTEVLSVLPCQRVSVDGFVLRETVAQYVQMLGLRKDELRRLGIKTLPEDMEEEDEVTLYGGGSLIFDEGGRLKWHVHKRVHDWKRQKKRLKYLARSGQALSAPSSRRFAEMHRRRALGIPFRKNEGDIHA